MQSNVPVPSPAGSPGAGVALVVLAVFISVWLGRRAQRRRKGRAISALLSVGIAVVALGMLAGWAPPSEAAFASEPTPSWLQHADGSPIVNICPYSADGKALSGVLLFDQDGRPIENVGVGQQVGGFEQAPGVPVIQNAYPRPLIVQDLDTGQVRQFACPASISAVPGGPARPAPSP